MSSVSATWKVGLTFAGIFVAGGVAGGFAALRIQKAYAQQAPRPDPLVMHMNNLDERLKLTEAQKKRIGVILAGANEEIVPLRKEMEKTFQGMNSRIRAELTPQQVQEYEEMRKRWNDRRGKRAPGIPGGGLRDDRDPGFKREDRKGPPSGVSESPVPPKDGVPPERL